MSQLNCMIMNEKQADWVKTGSLPGGKLSPILLNNGEYALPVRCAFDFHHIAHLPLFMGMEARMVDESEFPQPEEE